MAVRIRSVMGPVGAPMVPPYNAALFATKPRGFNVRISGFRGMSQLRQNAPRQLGDVSSALTAYEWTQLLTVDYGTPLVVNTGLILKDIATLVTIECPSNFSIRYEFNIPGRSVAAGSQSPRHSGFNIFPWIPGTIISVVDAIFFP